MVEKQWKSVLESLISPIASSGLGLMESTRSLGFCMRFVLRDTLLSMQNGPTLNKSLKTNFILLNYDQLKRMIEQVNAICASLLPDRSFRFFLSEDSPKSILWKHRTLVYCSFMQRRGGGQSLRYYTVKEFVCLHDGLKRIEHFSSAVPTTSQNNTTETTDDGWNRSEHISSAVPTTSQNDTTEKAEEENSCCICFDRTPDVILPCLHNFCQNCIQKWHGSPYKLPETQGPSGSSSSSIKPDVSNHEQCPLCRDTFSDVGNTWVMVDAPAAEEYLTEYSHCAAQMIERMGHAAKASTSESARESHAPVPDTIA